MAKSKAAVQTARAADKDSAEKKDAQLIGKLAKLWADYTKRGLKVRQETGSLLNESLGQPTERQARGRSVLKQAAERLEISASELNRMRWLAYFSSDEKSCWGETPPGNRTWTLFKERLPALIAALKGDDKLTAREGDDKLAVHEGNEKPQSSSGDKRGKTAVVDGILRLIGSATSKSRTENSTVDGAKREELIGGLQALVSAVSNIIGVRFRLVETEETGAHGLIENVVVPGYETTLAQSPCPMDTVAA